MRVKIKIRKKESPTTHNMAREEEYTVVQKTGSCSTRLSSVLRKEITAPELQPQLKVLIDFASTSVISVLQSCITTASLTPLRKCSKARGNFQSCYSTWLRSPKPFILLILKKQRKFDRSVIYSHCSLCSWICLILHGHRSEWVQVLLLHTLRPVQHFSVLAV